MTAANLAGQTLGGRYQIVRPIGEGGMGVVYEAIQLGLGRRVAIKLVSREGRGDEGALARFRREAEAAAALGHPNIVQVTDFVDAGDGQPFIVMEMVDGQSLRALVAREGRLAPARACFIAAQILSALSAAHRAGIVHRDIKPGNVVVTSTAAIRDFVKIVDFGIAKLQRPNLAVPSAAGVNTVIGTPTYMAPEQVTGTGIDARADIYGVGATMLNALTAHPPPHPPIPPIAHLAPWIPPALASVLDRALSVNPLGRYASAEAMLEALAPFLRESGVDPATLAGSGSPTVSVPPGRVTGPPSHTPYAATHPDPQAFHGSMAPRTSGLPPHTTVPPTMPSNMPPNLPLAPATTGHSTGWIVAVILGVVLLLVLLGGAAVAAYFIMGKETADNGAGGSKPTAVTSSPATGTATSTNVPSTATAIKPAPSAVKDGGGGAVDASAPAVDAGGGQVASKRTWQMASFRGTDAYDIYWLNKKLATNAFESCLSRPFFDPIDDRQGLWSLSYDPNGEIYEVYYAATYKKSGGANAPLRDCAKAAWVGIKLGAPRQPGAGTLQIIINVKSG